MKKINTALLLVLLLTTPAYPSFIPEYVLKSMSPPKLDTPEYDLARMKLVNPNFTTYPDASGIIWLKHTVISRSFSGGLEIARLYVILGRKGLGGKWLNWNIPMPAKGSIEVLEANVYDFDSLTRIGSASQRTNNEAHTKELNFQGLPDLFIISVSWREELPSQLSFEGLSWFQEDLRVWESIVDVYSPQSLAYKTFPEVRRPEVHNIDNEVLYSWRRINLEPFSSSGELVRLQRAGVAFSIRQGTSGVIRILRDTENLDSRTPPEDLSLWFRRSKPDGIHRLIDWLQEQPEIHLAEGSPRLIPSSGALTRREKILLAKSWLTTQKVDVSLKWILPFDPDAAAPFCEGMFYAPVLELQGIKDIAFHDMTDPKLLEGVKLFSFNSEGKMLSQRVPSSKASDNRLSAIMDLRLNEQGLLSGNVRILLRGAWEALLTGTNPSDGKVRGALLSLFPGLTNYKDVKYAKVKGVAEISYTLDNKPGIAGTGRGLLAMLPFFEPEPVRRLSTLEPPLEMLFPFIVDQNITLGFPKNASQALVQGSLPKNPDKINFSCNYQNRRHRLIADSRLELNMQNVSLGNMSLLRRCLDNWRAFSSRSIPVR